MLKNKIFWAILGFGLLLRLIGADHGFPFIFHPDEPALVRSATGIRFDPNPKHFDWPHLHFYLNFVLFGIFAKFRGLLQVLNLQSVLESVFPILWKDPLVFYLIARIFNGILGALTAIPIYLAGKKLFSEKIGLLSAFVFLIIPAHVHTSHFALIDVPMVFFLSWALYFSVKIFLEGKRNDYLLAGLFVGLATSVKYNGAISALIIVLAHLLSKNYKIKTQIISLFMAGLVALLGFVAGTPYAIFDFDDFSRSDSPVGAFWQFENVGKVNLKTHLVQFGEMLTTRFVADFGYIPLALFLVSLVFAFKQKDKRLLLIVLPALLMFFYFSSFEKLRSHYLAPVYPLIAIASAYILAKFNKILVFALLTVPLFMSIQNTVELYQKDTRVIAYEFLQDRVLENEEIFYNSSSFSQVAEKVSEDSTKIENSDELIGKKGYFVSYDSYDSINELELVLEVDSVGRKGENVKIYVFDQTQAN